MCSICLLPGLLVGQDITVLQTIYLHNIYIFLNSYQNSKLSLYKQVLKFNLTVEFLLSL